MSTQGAAAEPFTLLIAALGGEGGGVLMNWVVGAAQQAGLAVQATSVPGVAQRTGSTSYYIELSRIPVDPTLAPPVFALVPLPGRVDVVIASEAVEAGRLMERGFVSPKRTTLIYSSSRVYTTAEKLHMADGRYEHARVDAAAAKLALRHVALDLDELARAHGTMVSATMFGALAGAGVLPWSRTLCETQIGSGRNSAASLAGFAAAFEAVSGRKVPEAAAVKSKPLISPEVQPQKIDQPTSLEALVAHGRARCADFQDARYADCYTRRIERLTSAAAAQSSAPECQHVLEEAARRLALWMCYEDVPRVADLKTRPQRIQRIRHDAQVKAGEIVHVVDYLKPGLAEVADMMPIAIGARLAARHQRGKSLPLLSRGLLIKTTGVGGYLLLKLLAQGRRMRRASLRWEREQTAIDAWLAAMDYAFKFSLSFAGALAELPRVLKGYGETHERGKANYALIFDGIVRPALNKRDLDDDALRLRTAIAAALADPERSALSNLLAMGPISAAMAR